MSKRRVVVTGLGILSPLGNDVNSTWQNLLAGKSGINLIENFDTTNHTTKFAGQVKDFNCEEYISRKDAKKMDLFIQYGIAAGIQAIQDSGLSVTEKNAHRIGVAIGSGIGGLTLIEENHTALVHGGPRKVSPFFVPSTIVNMIAGHLSINYKLHGPNITIATACTTGVHNIGHAARMISYGDADVMIAGGAEKASSPLGIAGFGAARALSTRNDNPQAASRPWDIDRDGFVLGDGAGVMVLEEYEHAKARSAKIYAELVGFGMSGDGYHMTSPPADGAGAALAMSNALRDANLKPEQVGYVNAHGTATDQGDIAETQATHRILGRKPISSLKSYFGHTLGACGALEAWMSLQMMREGWFAPTLNLRQPDPQCGELDYIMGEARRIDCEYLQSNNFAFGGINTSIIIKRWS